MTTGAIPAGWYPDPGDAASARWWNGTAWSSETRAVPAAEPPAPPSVPVAPPWVATERLASDAIRLPDSASSSAWHGSPHTIGVWLLAFAPLITNVVVFAGVFAAAVAGISVPSPFVFVLPVILAEWVFAGLDRAALGRRGFDRPALAWMLLLPPLVYLIARGRVVRRAGAKAWPPELAYFLQVVLIGLANVALASLQLR